MLVDIETLFLDALVDTQTDGLLDDYEEDGTTQDCEAEELHLITELAKVVKKNGVDGAKKNKGRKPKNKA